MKSKKVLDFITMRPAFTQKNLSSVGLVALFVGVYSIMGGSVNTAPPHVEAGDTFGSVRDYRPSASFAKETSEEAQPIGSEQQKASAESIIGLKPTEEESARLRQIEKRGRLNDPEMPDEDGADGNAVDKDALVQGVDMTRHRDEWMLKKGEKRKIDNLSAIEDRLEVPRAKKNKYKVSYGDPQ